MMATDLAFRRRRPRVDGFSLLELIIVLTVLATLMAIAWPALRRPLAGGLIKEAAGQLSRDLSRARMMAIDSGCTVALRFEMDGSRYVVHPADLGMGGREGGEDSLGDSLTESFEDETEDDPLDRSSSQDDTTVSSLEDPRATALEATPILAELPNEVVFGDPVEAVQDTDSFEELYGDQMDLEETEPVETLLDEQDDGIGSVEWSSPVLFFPTGRSDQAELLLRDPDGRMLTVTIRGLTGAVVIGPVLAPPRETEDEQSLDDESETLTEPLEPTMNAEAFSDIE